jgi:transposase
MDTFLLSKDEINELRRAHRQARDKRDADRIKAVYSLAVGHTVSQVASILMLDEDTVRNYLKHFRTGGISALLKYDYKGSECRLTELEMSELEAELESSIYMTTQSVIEYVKKIFKVKYTQSGMRDLLHRMGYEYKKPKLVPGNPDLEKQELFAAQYEAFMLNKPADIEVLFIDAVHPEHNGMAAYGWIKRGQKRELKTNSGRERLNLHGALNAETYQVTVIESKTVNYESTLDLFQILEQTYPLAKKILLIADNAKYHFSKEVMVYLQTSRIQLVPLPSYSPNLNLIERLWKFFKKKVLYNQYYENLTAFRNACIHFFRNIKDVREEMIAFIGHDFELAY